MIERAMAMVMKMMEMVMIAMNNAVDDYQNDSYDNGGGASSAYDDDFSYVCDCHADDDISDDVVDVAVKIILVMWTMMMVMEKIDAILTITVLVSVVRTIILGLAIVMTIHTVMDYLEND